MLPLVFLLVFGAVSLVAWELLRPKENAVARRISPATPALTRERQLSGSFYARSVNPMLRRAGNRIGSLLLHEAASLLRHIVKCFEQRQDSSDPHHSQVCQRVKDIGSRLFQVNTTKTGEASMGDTVPQSVQQMCCMLIAAGFPRRKENVHPCTS